MNTRSVLHLTHTRTGRQVAFVAIGALLVGSIQFTAEKGSTVKRGEELGYVLCVVVECVSDLFALDQQLFCIRRKYNRCYLPKGCH